MTTQEAVLSSRIEGTRATLGDVFKFEAGDEPGGAKSQEDIREIINYRIALTKAERELRKKPFNLNLLNHLHAILLNSVRGRNLARGKIRTTQNWIGPPDTPIEKALFVPPNPQRVLEFLDNWEKYYHSDRPDILVQLSIIHAQFEIIHPFLDGNGRLGRMLIPIFLYEKKALSRPMFYLSAYLEENRDAYLHHLRRLGKKLSSWNEWIQFFLSAVDQQAQANAAKARSLIELYERLKVQVIEITHSQYAIPLLDHLFTRPIFQITHLQHKNMPTRATITWLVTQLKDAGILEVLREGSGRRGQVFALSELIDVTEGRKGL